MWLCEDSFTLQIFWERCGMAGGRGRRGSVACICMSVSVR